MQAIQFLKQEHGKAKAAFQEIEGAPAGQRRGLWMKLHPELALHEKMEEQHLYGPAAREVQVDASLAEYETAHHREVQEAEGLIKEINRLDPSGDRGSRPSRSSAGRSSSTSGKRSRRSGRRSSGRGARPGSRKAGRQMAAMKREEAAASGRRGPREPERCRERRGDSGLGPRGRAGGRSRPATARS